MKIKIYILSGLDVDAVLPVAQEVVVLVKDMEL
jgi:hypothetical protein